MSKSQREKGARAERAVATIYREHGFEVARVPNSGGLDTKGDVLGIPGVHCEVKHNEALNIWKSLLQAEAEAPAGCIPAVHFRRNRSGFYVALPLDDFIGLLKEAQR